MSEKNHNIDPLEKLFKQKAEDHHISYDEQDWVKLEERLDLADKEHAARVRRRWMVAAATLIIALWGYFTVQDHFRINQINQKITENTKNPVLENKNSSRRQSKSDRKADEDKPQPEHAPVTGLQAPESSSVKQSSPNTKITEKENKADYLQTDHLHHVTKIVNQPLTSGIYSASENSFALIAVNEDATIAQAALPKTENRDGVPSIPNRNASLSVDLREQGRSKASAPLTVGFVMSPDLSTVGSISDFTNPGYKLGVNFEYNLNRNFTVSTGIARSKIYYTAYSNEINFPARSGSSDGPSYNTDGACTLLDIPINIKYNFLHFSRSRFFATAGVSSYIMLNERYHFNYENDNKGALQSWNENTGKSYLLSNVNFSIGYEFDLLPGVSLRAEPFIKIPIREVGWEKVKLYSMGSFISFNYKLGLER